MDAKTSNFLFIGLFFIFISPCTQQDEIASGQDQHWITDNWITIKADDWVKTQDLTNAKPFFVKLFRGETKDSLKFHPDLIKLKPNGEDPVKFSLKYWSNKNNYGFQFFDHLTKKHIDLDKNQQEDFITNDEFAKTKFTFDDLKQSELIPAFRTLDQIILLQNVTVEYSDFKNSMTNFVNKTTANNEMEFVFSSTNEWGQIQQVFEKEQFDRVCIETDLINFQMYLSMENDDYVKPVSQAYSESFSKTNGLCLNEIFAINPNGRFMIIVKVLESQPEIPKEYSIKFHLGDANQIVPKNPEDAPFNDWIYNVDLPDVYDFELQSSDGKADFYACDSAATCYKYKKISVSEYELDETDRKSLKSPIIKRIAIPHDTADKDFKLKESFNHKILKNRLENKTTKISDDQATIDVHHSTKNLKLDIPYIDLRVYEPTVNFGRSIVKSVSITSKSAPRKHRSQISFGSSMKNFFPENTIDLGRFFHPRIGDNFNDYQLSFNFIVDKNKDEVVIKLGNKAKPTNIAADGCATAKDDSQQCLKESDWIMAPITSASNKIKLGDAVFELDKTDGSIQINHQIQFYDGTGTNPAQNPKKIPITNSKITYSIEEKINGPYKVFYWLTIPKGVGLKNYSDNFQDITNKDEEQIRNGPTNKWYEQKYDPVDESACPNGFEWNASKQRCFLHVDKDETKNHLSTTIKCDERNGCTNIFDKPLMGSRLYSNGLVLELIGQNEFNAVGIQSILIPFVDPTNHNNQISIPITTESGKDFCIDFKHFGYKSQLYASGEIDPEYKILFEDDETSMKKNNYLYKKDSICASDLSPELIDQIKSIVLTFKYDPELGGPLEQSIADLKWSNQSTSQTPIKGIMQEDSDKLDKFFSKYDEDFFTEESTNIKFMLKKTKLAPGQEKFQRILSTKFLPLYKDGKNKTIDIGLSYEGDFADLGGDVFIQFRPESKSKYNIEIWKSQSMQHIVYEPKDPNSLVDYVQVQFVFQVQNLSEMKDKMNSTYFTIKDLSIDDPCVGEGNNPAYFCSGLTNACKRHFHRSPHWSKWHTCDCSAEPFRFGDECEKVDYCKRDNRISYCLQNNYGKCKNDQTKNSWHCTCDKARTWIPIGEFCSKKIDIDKCPENEIIQVKDLDRSECVCEDGRVRINQECVEFDVCNVAHRNASGLSPEKPCTDQYAECRKTSFSEYQCVCKDFLTNKQGIFDHNAQCIDQLCNLNLKCEQKCQPNSTNVEQSKCQCFNDNYEMDEDQKHCKIKAKFESEEKDCLPSEDVEKLSVFERAYLETSPSKKCRCKLDGYEFNPNSKKCEAPTDEDKDRVKKILHCKQIKMNDDDQPECVCPNGQVYNHQLGKCSYKSCPQPDQIRFISDHEHPDESECLDACDEKLVQQCHDHFARCNKKKVIEKLRESTTNQNDVLVFINGTDQNLDQTMYCDCIVGFRNISDKCQVDVGRSMMTVELSFINTKDKQQTMNYLEKILKQFFPNVDIESINCKDSGVCQVSMVAEATLKPETVVQSLENQCVDENELKKKGGNSENCVYILKNPKSDDFMIVLSKSKSNQSIKCEIDRCFSDPCKRFRHTACATESKSDTFACKCIDPYKNVESKPITKGMIETCALPNCEQKGLHCDDPSAKCLILAPEDNDDVLSKFSSKSQTVQDGGLQICICDDGYILPNISAHCDELENCDLDCHQHGKCYFQHYDDPKTISKICRCDKGWIGDFCETEIDDNHNHDKNNTIVVNNQSDNGFKISTIVLAVMSALLVVGVVYLFMKK